MSPRAGNWITISYGGVVNTTALTHNGDPVGDVVRGIPVYGDSYRGLVQQYVEPLSFLCHDVLLALTGPDSFPLINITSHYPPGSVQPAWASLFREGTVQLFYSPRRVRLFVKGENPAQSFSMHHSVVRHALLDVLERYPSSIDSIEVYVFRNDYARREIRLSLVPAIFPAATSMLSPRKTPVDLGAIDRFLQAGVVLDAVAVDADTHLRFYGRRSSGPTIAGSPLSLSDLAVVYRAIFHYGYNPPFVSLDKHEDNRFARVNFGGLLENTRVGLVVLEADKLFKTLGSGLDPNTGTDMTARFAAQVTGFLTEDERLLLEDLQDGHTRLRYWFYPDSIGTVTDGSVGVVTAHRFLADVERMDGQTKIGSATRTTIDHLNRHVSAYERAHPTYEELGTVGRIMALVHWLREMRADERVELDDFLAVPLPACTTPTVTKKMLVVSAITYPWDSPPDVTAMRTARRVFALSHVLDGCDPATSDIQLLSIAERSAPDISVGGTPRVQALRATLEARDSLVRRNDSTIMSLAQDIERKRAALDVRDESAVDAYNRLIEQYNRLAEYHRQVIDAYNDAVKELAEIDVRTRHVVSVSGGIDLSPKHFKAIARDPASPKLLDILGRGDGMSTSGARAAVAGRADSTGISLPWRVNLMPKGHWTTAAANGEGRTYTSRADDTTRMSTSFSSGRTAWHVRTTVNNMHHMVKYSRAEGRMWVTDPMVGGCVRGVLSPDRNRVVFSR
jgi:hypothetical protein